MTILELSMQTCQASYLVFAKLCQSFQQVLFVQTDGTHAAHPVVPSSEKYSSNECLLHRFSGFSSRDASPPASERSTMVSSIRVKPGHSPQRFRQRIGILSVPSDSLV